MKARPWDDWTELAAQRIQALEAERDPSTWEVADVIYNTFQAEWARQMLTVQAAEPAPAADLRQVGGDHYRSKAVQPWEAMAAWMTREQFRGFLRGNVIKYLARCDERGGIQDLKKAAHYLDKLIELEAAA